MPFSLLSLDGFAARRFHLGGMRDAATVAGQPRALKPAAPGGFAAWVRRRFGRAPPAAEIVALPEIRLGDKLEIIWRFAYGAREITNVSVALVGSEIARERISARTGISTVTDKHDFATLAIDRKMPEPHARGTEGRGAVVVPPGSVPSVAGKLNEISWAVVVEAAYQDRPIWRGEFPVVVLPRSP
jgi:hypothetical protein